MDALGSQDLVHRVVALRLVVGALGEADRAAWWSSHFLSSTARTFLAPAFGDGYLDAQYQGVVEAARKVHDERIGIGRVFHLFRLPEAIERPLHDAMRAREFGEAFSRLASDHQGWKNVLLGLSGDAVDADPGPLRVGGADDFSTDAWLPLLPHTMRLPSMLASKRTPTSPTADEPNVLHDTPAGGPGARS